jgi:sugar lactone lactonase YvrE
MNSKIIVFFLLWSIGVQAQDNLAYQFSELQQLPIHQLTFDAHNQLLASTEQGLYRIKNFEQGAEMLLSGGVCAAAVGSDNQIWTGLYSNQLSTLKREFYSVGLQKNNAITAVLVFQDALLLGTNQGLFTFSLKELKERESFTTSNSKIIGNQINDLELDNLGRIWIATDRGISIFDGKRWETQQEQRQVTALAHSGGEMWAAVDKTIQSWDSKKKWTVFAMPANQSAHTIRDLAFDLDGNLWLAAKSVLKLDKNSGEFKVYDFNSGLFSTMILSLAVDLDNQIWVGTAGNGIFKISNAKPSRPIATAPERPAPLPEIVTKPEITETPAFAVVETAMEDPEREKRKRFGSEPTASKREEDDKQAFAKAEETVTKGGMIEKEKSNINFLGNRLIKDGISVDVTTMTLDIAIWDGQNTGGDTVSIYYNGVCILKNVILSDERQYFKLDISPRFDNDLVLYAHNGNASGQATATVAIEGEVSPTKWIMLNSDLKKCDKISFKLVY